METLLNYLLHFGIATFGALLWNFGVFRNAKNKAEKEKTLFSFEDYKRDHWEDWIWAFLCAFPLVWFMKDLIHLLNVHYGLPEYEGYYIMAGPMSIVLGHGITWILNKFEK